MYFKIQIPEFLFINGTNEHKIIRNILCKEINLQRTLDHGTATKLISQVKI